VALADGTYLAGREPRLDLLHLHGRSADHVRQIEVGKADREK
jgi:hypothetical protein